MAQTGWALAVHGGSGRIVRGEVPPAQDAAARAGLTAALEAGAAVLGAGGSALDAVEAAVRVLEDDPAFNAGRGAVFSGEGRNELDAAIMDGASRRAGAVAGVSRAKNPVSLARSVLEDGRHVLLSGHGADLFAEEHGLELAAPAWFHTDERWRQYEELGRRGVFDTELKYGTVGAVARDTGGALAAATSTGGLTGKRWGRIGDSPLIGAGTWADGSVAVSATGSGEHFVRVAAAHQIAARVGFAGEAIDAAGRGVLADLGALGGTGGLLLMGARGEGCFAFTTPGMNRGRLAEGGTTAVMLYGDEG
jgi:beta-aspartyl-peptidase (threonine type)